jgi:uncharacterized protein (DUF2344 family)
MNISRKIEKEIIKKTNVNTYKKIYHFKNFTFKHWFLYPLVFVIWIYESISEKHYKSLIFTDEKANKIVNRYLIKVFDISEERLSFCMNWSSWCFENHAHLWDKTWCRKYRYEIFDFIKNKYEIKGYTKSIVEDYDVWIVFKK